MPVAIKVLERLGQAPNLPAMMMQPTLTLQLQLTEVVKLVLDQGVVVSDNVNMGVVVASRQQRLELQQPSP